MDKNDVRALVFIGGSFVAYWAFCISWIVDILAGG